MSVRTAYRPRINPRMRGMGQTSIYQLEQQMDSAQAALANAQTAGDAAGVAAANATIANVGAQLNSIYTGGSTPTPPPAPVTGAVCPAWGCGPPPFQILPFKLQPNQPIDFGGTTSIPDPNAGNRTSGAYVTGYLSSVAQAIPAWGWVAAGIGALFLFGGGKR